MRVLFGLTSLGLSAALAAAQSEPEVLAVVNGEQILRAEVLASAAAELRELEAVQPAPATFERDRLRILWTALDATVEERLIALEAASLNMTPERLLEIEVESNLATPSDAEVTAFYEQNRAQIPLPLAEAFPLVREYMVDQQRQRLRRAVIQRYRQTYGVTTYLDPLRTEVATVGHPSLGPADAPVTIVEFGDFQCPVCASLHPTLKRVLELYPDDVRIVFRHFPLRNIHPQAQKASEAAVCANEQGSFWAYHDSLFVGQSALEIDDLKRRAGELGLDAVAFNACLDSGSKYNVVQFDLDEGRAAGVSGTPTLFINGRFLAGPQPRDIQEVIEDELQRTR